MKATIHQLHDEAFEISGNAVIKIPEGVYAARFSVPHRTFQAFGRGCLVLTFDITSDKHKGVKLEAFYKVKTIGKLGKKGRFSVTQRSGFYRDFVRGTDFNPCRLDRIPMTRLRGREFQVKVVTVKKDGDRDVLPEPCQYSKVAKILSGGHVG